MVKLPETATPLSYITTKKFCLAVHEPFHEFKASHLDTQFISMKRSTRHMPERDERRRRQSICSSRPGPQIHGTDEGIEEAHGISAATYSSSDSGNNSVCERSGPMQWLSCLKQTGNRCKKFHNIMEFSHKLSINLR